MNLGTANRSEEKWLLGRATVTPGGWTCCHCCAPCCTCCAAADAVLVDDEEL